MAGLLAAAGLAASPGSAAAVGLATAAGVAAAADSMTAAAPTAAAGDSAGARAPVVSVPMTPAPAASPPLRLLFAPGATVSAEAERFLREDQDWLGRLSPAERRLLPPESPETARRWLAELAAGRDAAGAAVAAAGGRPSPDATAPAARGLLARLCDRWQARGYLGCRAASADTGAAGPAGAPRAILVTPGPVFRVGTVRVDGPDFPGRSALLAATLPRSGGRFRAADWDEAVARLLAGVGEAGYPFARWVVNEVLVRAGGAAVDVSATLFTGHRAVLGAQDCDLASVRAAAFLRRASGLRVGGFYRESDLERARQRLVERGLWDRVGEPVVYVAGTDTVGVYWPVQARSRPNRFSAVLGFSRRDAASPARLSGQVDLWLPDLGGSGRQLGLDWSDDGADRSHLGFRYLEPLAFGSALDLDTALDHEVVADSYTRFSMDGRARLGVVAAWGLELGLGWDRSTFSTGDWVRTARWRARAAFLHRRGDLTRSGWEGVFAYETARRQAAARADTAADGETALAVGSLERQRLWELHAAGELFVAPALSLAARGTLNEVRGEGGTIPLSEQYWFGGANTLRGYRENQFRGERAAYGSLEVRIGRPRQARLYTFWDLGYFRFAAPADGADGSGARTWRSGSAHGYGLGLEVGAGSGDMSLAIGFPNTLDFQSAKLHVSLRQAF